jgi:hypothetical protein
VPRQVEVLLSTGDKQGTPLGGSVSEPGVLQPGRGPGVTGHQRT